MAKRRAKKATNKPAAKPAAAKVPEKKAPASTPARPLASPLMAANPFAAMRRMVNEMDRMFEDLRQGEWPHMPHFRGWPTEKADWAPSVEVTEKGGNLVIRADLPGIAKKDLSVEVRDDVVCIKGERRKERESTRKGVYRSERSYGSFFRQIPLPEGIDTEQAKATFRDGVLEVTLPAPPPAAKGRRVPVAD